MVGLMVEYAGTNITFVTMFVLNEKAVLIIDKLFLFFKCKLL